MRDVHDVGTLLRLTVSLMVLAGCSAPMTELDAGSTDAGARSTEDAGASPDGGAPHDAGTFDAGLADAGSCLDGDGDGRGVGCALGPDCDDSDAMKRVTLQGFVDGDGDGVTVGPAVMLCTGGALPSGYRAMASAVSDCDDANPTLTLQLTGFVDADGDGATLGMGVSLCTTGRLPATYVAVASAVPDCDDTNASVKVELTGVLDADGDQATVGAPRTLCTNGTLPATYRAMASATPDCDDTDATKFVTRTGFLDADRDQYTVGAAVMVCSGSALPPTYRAAATATDCDDTNASRFASVTAYADQDWDGYSVATATTLCGLGVVPPGYLAAASPVPDCNDTTAGVSPGAPELADDGLDNDCSQGDATHTTLATADAGWYVDGAGCAGTPTGSSLAPFCSIQDAVTFIDQNTSLGSGTIFVSAGTYDAVTVPISTNITILGGYRRQFIGWTRDLVNNPVRIRATTGDTSLTVNLGAVRVVLDGVTVVAPVGGAGPKFAVRSNSPLWLSRTNLNPDMTSTTITLGAELSADTTIVGGRQVGFSRKVIEFTGNATRQLRIFEATLGAQSTLGPVSVVDFAITTGGGRIVRSQLSIVGGTDQVGVLTARETTLVGNTIDLQAGSAARWVLNEGNLVALGNKLTGYSNSDLCTGVVSSAAMGTMSSTVLAGNVIYLQSLAMNCTAIDLSRGTGTLAHNVVRVSASGATTGLVLGSGAGPTTLLNNIFAVSSALTPSSGHSVAAYGNTFDRTVLDTIAGTGVFAASMFDACQWPGCVAASGTRVAMPDFVSLAMNNYGLLDTSVCLNGGVSPAAVGLPLVPVYAYAINGVRPLGAGFDVGAYER